MIVRVNIRHLEEGEPVGKNPPGIAAVHRLCRTELPANVDGVAIGIVGVNQQHVVVKRLAPHDVHVRGVGIGVHRRFERETDGCPGSPAVQGAEQIELASITLSRGEGIDGGVARRAHAEGSAACRHGHRSRRGRKSFLQSREGRPSGAMVG